MNDNAKQEQTPKKSKKSCFNTIFSHLSREIQSNIQWGPIIYVFLQIALIFLIQIKCPQIWNIKDDIFSIIFWSVVLITIVHYFLLHFKNPGYIEQNKSQVLPDQSYNQEEQQRPQAISFLQQSLENPNCTAANSKQNNIKDLENIENQVEKPVYPGQEDQQYYDSPEKKQRNNTEKEDSIMQKIGLNSFVQSNQNLMMEEATEANSNTLEQNTASANKMDSHQLSIMNNNSSKLNRENLQELNMRNIIQPMSANLNIHNNNKQEDDEDDEEESKEPDAIKKRTRIFSSTFDLEDSDEDQYYKQQPKSMEDIEYADHQHQFDDIYESDYGQNQPQFAEIQKQQPEQYQQNNDNAIPCVDENDIKVDDIIFNESINDQGHENDFSINNDIFLQMKLMEMNQDDSQQYPFQHDQQNDSDNVSLGMNLSQDKDEITKNLFQEDSNVLQNRKRGKSLKSIKNNNSNNNPQDKYKVQDEGQNTSKTQNVQDDNNDLIEISIEKRYCPKCNIEQPIRTKHCNECNRCVATHDHHCPWIGTCIGEKNKCIFWWYLLFQCTEIVIPYIEMILTFFDPDSKNEGWFKGIGISIVVLLLLSIFLLMVGVLLAYHTYLVLRNITTWEHMSWYDIQYLSGYNIKGKSPFSKGFKQNVIQFCQCLSLKDPFIDWKIYKSKKEIAKQKGQVEVAVFPQITDF